MGRSFESLYARRREISLIAAVLREWAVVALRNLCEDNHENQEFIKSLEFQGVRDTPELQELGLQAHISATGKVNLVKRVQ